MTRKERLEMIISGNITEELIEECKVELEKLNAHSAAALAKSKESAQYKENKVYEEKIYQLLDEEPMQIEEIRALVAPEVTRQRMTAICTNLVREGRIQSTDIKVKGKGKRKAYMRG